MVLASWVCQVTKIYHSFYWHDRIHHTRIHAVWYHPWLDTQYKSIYRNVFVLSSSYNKQSDLWTESVCSRRCQRHVQCIQAT